MSIGEIPSADRARGFTVTDSGLVVVPKDYSFSTDASEREGIPRAKLDDTQIDDSEEQSEREIARSRVNMS
jgi:hypothetical protein